MTDRLTLATSTGLPFIALMFHVAMGVTGLAAGLIAIALRKGGQWHRRAGLVFVCAMIANGISAMGISAYEGKSILSGALTLYFVFTAFTAVRTLPALSRRVDIAFTLLGFTFAVWMYLGAFTALGMPRQRLNGAPAGMLFFLATVTLLAATGDLRMVLAGGVRGTRRIARHLWRMCFGLFIASGSFAAQLLRLMPPKLNSMPMVLLLGGGPLVVLLYWMWRVRLRQNVRGLTTAKPIDAPSPV
jgi:uncharacterized membrane protein